ncbi:MAG TPA: proline--tRNA ligase [Cyclobacteriaceae bacterium]|nr:proline--tRNA ligase [Cyclobacteriaceae bacterium]
MEKGLPKRSDDYSQWYNELVKRADLAENSPVRGCMIIKPYGFSIWEKIQATLDGMFKETGHSNCYFPIFIPKSYLSREAAHVEGFAKECAVVTHYRLKNDATGRNLIVDPEAKLEEELIVRPTSETIIWNSYKNWIQSYRDLPLLLNQWANVVRWEMRTRLFLRTSEFLWQEGHTAHATMKEAEEETFRILDVYAEFAEKHMAIPVLRGRKSESEKFAGAVNTYCIEALMQDGKALQAGTSHFLGQNFARAFDVKFTSREGKQEFVWGTSWGVSTRLMGALVMAHSDDDGLVLPPQLAPIQVVIVPIYKTPDQAARVMEKAQQVKKHLESKGYRVHFDSRDTQTPGWKFAEYEMKGVPLRIALGPRDLESDSAELTRRDTKEKRKVSMAKLSEEVDQSIQSIHSGIYRKALKNREDNTFYIDNYDEFKARLDSGGGFIYAHWDGSPETEARIKEETKATIRLIPLTPDEKEGKCIVTGKPSRGRVVFARAY